MKKNFKVFAITLLMFSATIMASAQTNWSPSFINPPTNTQSMVLYNGNFVGIGTGFSNTTPPSAKLHVNGSFKVTGKPTIVQAGYYNFFGTLTSNGTQVYSGMLRTISAPSGTGGTNGSIPSSYSWYGAGAYERVGGSVCGGCTLISYSIQTPVDKFTLGTTDADLLVVDQGTININTRLFVNSRLDVGSSLNVNAGDLKIGAGNLNVSGNSIVNGFSKVTGNLMVNGVIATTKVKVNATATPDFVFDENFKIMPLEELENYVKTNKHLPNIPSAEEAKANGMDLTDFTNGILQRLEELTLHVIEQEKKNTELTKIVNELKRKNN